MDILLSMPKKKEKMNYIHSFDFTIENDRKNQLIRGVGEDEYYIGCGL